VKRREEDVDHHELEKRKHKHTHKINLKKMPINGPERLVQVDNKYEALSMSLVLTTRKERAR